MGIRIHRNTWRAPLQLIDSWLPQPEAAPPRRKLTSITQRFARAGWLGRGARLPDASTSPIESATPAQSAQPCSHSPEAIRMVHAAAHMDGGARTDTRVVLSGRIADVCAELERLAALEPGLTPAHH